MSAIKYVLPSNASDLNKLISSAINSAKTMQTKIQVAAVGILFHAAKHGDYTAANTLVDGLGNSARRDALVTWFKLYGGLTISEGKAFDGWNGKAHIEANFEVAKATMWNDAKKESNPFVELDMEADLRKLVDKYSRAKNKAAKAGSEFKGKINTQINDQLMAQLMELCNFEVIIEDDAA